MDAIEGGYSTPPNREDSEHVADSDESEPDEQGEKGGEDEGGEDECEASEEECDDDEDDEDDEIEGEAGGRKRRFYERGRREWTELAGYDRTAMLDTEIDAAILAIATEKMQESGLMEWPEMKRADKKKTISLWVQNRVYVKAGGNTQVESYYCPLRYRCKCKVQLRITRSPASVFFDWSGGPHTFELCHSEETCKFLSVRQRVAVAKLARSNPQASGTEVRRALQRFSPNSKVEASMVRSVRKLVAHQKRKERAASCFGIEITDSYASVAALGNKLWFGDIMRRHNDEADDFHFSDPHAVICIGNVAEADSGRELFINLTTAWNVLNLGRGLASGWPNTLCGDGTGKFSKKQATMVSLGIISIPAKYNILNYAVGPVENEDLFLRSWQGIEATWYALMEQWKICPMSKEHCPMCHLVSFFRENVDVKDSLRSRILISKARSDNTDLFRNFADKIKAIPLQDEVHGHGNIDIAV